MYLMGPVRIKIFSSEQFLRFRSGYNTRCPRVCGRLGIRSATAKLFSSRESYA